MRCSNLAAADEPVSHDIQQQRDRNHPGMGYLYEIIGCRLKILPKPNRESRERDNLSASSTPDTPYPQKIDQRIEPDINSSPQFLAAVHKRLLNSLGLPLWVEILDDSATAERRRHSAENLPRIPVGPNRASGVGIC